MANFQEYAEQLRELKTIEKKEKELFESLIGVAHNTDLAPREKGILLASFAIDRSRVYGDSERIRIVQDPKDVEEKVSRFEEVMIDDSQKVLLDRQHYADKRQAPSFCISGNLEYRDSPTIGAPSVIAVDYPKPAFTVKNMIAAVYTESAPKHDYAAIQFFVGDIAIAAHIDRMQKTNPDRAESLRAQI